MIEDPHGLLTVAVCHPLVLGTGAGLCYCQVGWEWSRLGGCKSRVIWTVRRADFLWCRNNNNNTCSALFARAISNESQSITKKLTII